MNVMHSHPLSTIGRLLATVGALAVLATGVPATASGAWSIVTTPGTFTASGLNGVDCASASSCLAVGFILSDPLAETWNGTAWSLLTPASSNAAFRDTSCAPGSPAACISVGYKDVGGTIASYAEKFDGTTWTALTTPNPSGATSTQLEAVACTTTSACTAVGWYTTSGGATLPVAARWNGSSWSLQTLALPSGTTNAKLQGVVCVSSTSCGAVGYYDATGNPRRTLIEAWSGTTWSVSSSPNPSGATESQLYDISCPSSACTAVGSYKNSSSVQHALAMYFNGSSWTLQTVPDPSGSSSPVLYSVSCVASPSYGCEAVGESAGFSDRLPLAEVGTTTAWAVQSVPVPSGADDTELEGVWCSTTCRAVGRSFDQNMGTRPLIEHGP